MDDLPPDLLSRIFSRLDYRHLASAAQVCRKWSCRSRQCVLWRQLYEQRWGKMRIMDHPPEFKSWKQAYETKDRSERIGMDLTVTREGLDYFLVQEGKLLRYLGSYNHNAGFSASENGEAREQEEHVTSQVGLVDKLLFCLGDLDYVMRQRKRNRIA